MAVTAGATPLDYALDRAAGAIGAAMHAAAWREVARHALLEDQVDVLVVAVREWVHWRGVLVAVDASHLGVGM